MWEEEGRDTNRIFQEGGGRAGVVWTADWWWWFTVQWWVERDGDLRCRDGHETATPAVAF